MGGASLLYSSFVLGPSAGHIFSGFSVAETRLPLLLLVSSVLRLHEDLHIRLFRKPHTLKHSKLGRCRSLAVRRFDRNQNLNLLAAEAPSCGRSRLSRGLFQVEVAVKACIALHSLPRTVDLL